MSRRQFAESGPWAGWKEESELAAQCMLIVRCYSLIPGPSPPPGRPRRPSSPGLQPLNSSHFTDSLSGTRLFSRARNRWLERHPGKPGRRRPQRPSSAGDPCPSKTRTPRETPEMSGGDLYRGQRMALATNLPAASRLRTPRRPPPRSLQPPRGPALGPSCSGDTEGDPRHVPTARTEAPPRSPWPPAAAPSLPSPRRRAWTAGEGRGLRRFRGAGGRGQRRSPPHLRWTLSPGPLALCGPGGDPTHRFLAW